MLASHMNFSKPYENPVSIVQKYRLVTIHE